jgi:multidrug efflux system membrane fusion protein
MREARIHALGAVAAAALALAGCREPAPPRPAPPPPKVTVARPETRDYEEYEEFTGWTSAVEKVEVRARVRGHIEKIHFREGDIVKKGDILYSLDKRPLVAAVDSAIALKQAYEAQRVAAQKEFVRLSELLAKGGASRAQTEKAEADVGSLDATIVAQGREIDRLKLEVEYSSITSPMAGRIGETQLSEGNLVNAGGSDPLLATIVALDPMHVHFSVPEKTLLKVRARRATEVPGGFNEENVADRKLPFQFALETDQGFPREGVIDFGDNQVDAATGTILLRGSVENKQGLLLAGVRVRVRVVVRPREKVLVVPDEALLADMDRRYVLVAAAGNKAERKDVRPGRLLDDGMRILLPLLSEKAGAAVAPGDRVIVQGHQRARIHYPVEPLDAAGNPVGESAGEGGK